MIAEEDDDIIITNVEASLEPSAAMQPILIYDADEEIPDKIYWESILGALEKCSTTTELQSMVKEISSSMRPLHKRKDNIHFNPDLDYIDASAMSSLPSDGPTNVHPIWTKADGNCMSRALSRSYNGTKEMHLEVHARIVIDGVLHKDLYVTDSILSRGATLIRSDEDLPSVYAKYSDSYVNGQKITRHTIDYLYFKEMHECCKINSFMGLWQLAQAANVLKCPIQSIFPEGTDPVMRMDFHRTFLPLNYKEDSGAKPIMIMWTGHKKGSFPNHFVPLLPKRNKYDIQIINLTLD